MRRRSPPRPPKGSASLKDEETKARLRELRPLLSFKANPQLAGKQEDIDESKVATTKEKLSAGVEKLKLKASGAF